MKEDKRIPDDRIDAGELKLLLAETAAETGEQFFRELVKNLVKVLGVKGAWVTEFLEKANRLNALAFYLDQDFVPHYEYDIKGTPCEPVIKEKDFFHVPEKVINLFPDDPDLKPLDAVSYMGIPLLDIDNTILGHLAVLDSKKIPAKSKTIALFKIFALRAAAELRRLRAENEVREKEQKLSRLIDSAMDAIIEFDLEQNINRVNPAANKIFRYDNNELVTKKLSHLLSKDSNEKISDLINNLDKLPAGQRYLWVSGGLKAVCRDKSEFMAEASLSRFELNNNLYFSLIMRNVNDRIEAERKISSLTAETDYLREEIKSINNFGDIIGESKSFASVLKVINSVAGTDTTVLIIGETGTGKEVIARAIHETSKRKNKQLIKVNCAAIPATLIESEFFGHEKGAFTGATSKREGRFSLADGGTIFLDEVGDFPLDLQVKLLRVLQESEFELVGSSTTKKVDIRVIAATHRDLKKMVQEGTFREDLFYRLNVFPIKVPALRVRGDDVILLASTFAQKCAANIGREIIPFSEDDIKRLKKYDWPGNIRELQNVIERAVILSEGGRWNFTHSLSDGFIEDSSEKAITYDINDERIFTIQELQELEKINIIRALKTSRWRVSGNAGAAKLLGIPQSTLSSRIKALNIEIPK
jgi:PAS domain S-box-containing protein